MKVLHVYPAIAVYLRRAETECGTCQRSESAGFDCLAESQRLPRYKGALYSIQGRSAQYLRVSTAGRLVRGLRFVCFRRGSGNLSAYAVAVGAVCGQMAEIANDPEGYTSRASASIRQKTEAAGIERGTS